MHKKTVVYKLKSFPNISETFVVYSIVAAIENGYDVTIIVDEINPISESSQPELIAEYQLIEKVVVYEEPNGRVARILRAMGLLLNPMMIYYFGKFRRFRKNTSLTFLFQLAFYRNYRNAGTFHVHFADNLRPLMALKKIGFLKSNIVVTFHGYDAHFFPPKETYNEHFLQFESVVDHITVNSKYLKNVLMEKGFASERIKIIPVGIDTAMFKGDSRLSPGATFQLISIGRLIPLKGQELGIKAVKILIDKGYEIQYSIIGGGPMKTVLTTLISSLNLKRIVTLVGEKQQSEIKEYLSTHDLFLMTSIADEEGRREAFGLVSLEAQTMGVPVVGFNSGGFPETVLDGETGLIVPDGDIALLSKAIEQFILDPALWLKMSKRGPKFVREKFDRELISKQYLALYT